MESNSQTLSFYTTGEGFTPLVRNFINEGSYKTAYEILEGGGLSLPLIKKFFLLEAHFEGDTRETGGLTLVEVPIRDPKIDYSEFLHTGIATCLEAYNRTIRYQFTGDDEIDEEDFYEADEIKVHQFAAAKDKVENIKYLLKVFEESEIINIIYRQVIRNNGFEFAKPHIKNAHGGYGVILPNGDFISCRYDEHKYLYPILCDMNLASAGDWTKDELAIHVSSGQLSGNVAHSIMHPHMEDAKVTEAQLQTLFNFRNQIDGSYGRHHKLSYELLVNVQEMEDFGNKYNNLIFLRTYYKNIKLPQISKTPIEGVKNCLRTSPLQSLPGLLESKFDITENSIAEMEKDFEQVKGVISGDNKLNIFYQEYLDGSNGICHCFAKGEITYSLSTNRGDIVSGKEGNDSLDTKQYKELTKIVSELYEDINCPLQIEFVISDSRLYIVQLRLLENNYDKTVILTPPKNALAFGKTFSQGKEIVDVKDILVVDIEAATPRQIVGKKALLVRQDVEFAHILALSKALRIPSIYAIGDVKLPATGKIKITAYNKEAWIEKA